VVIGGGPAGSLCATFLAQSGYEVVLLEKQRHPRLVVGENLIPDFWKYCDEAKVSDQIAADGFVQKAGGTVNWHGTTRLLAFKDFGYTRPALHVERDRFDHILLQNARVQGALVFEEASVLTVDFASEEQAKVTYRRLGCEQAAQIGCRFVVDASGQNAVVGRQLGLRVIDDAFRFMSVWGYFRNSRYLAADGRMYPAASVRAVAPTTFVSSLPHAGDWGWSWHIMLRDTTSVGVVVPIDTMKAVKERQISWDQYLIDECQSVPTLRELLATAELCEGSTRVIRDYSYRSTQVAGPGYFLIGDAAGFVDPIFSVGVVLGMYSARAAAWAIDRCFRAPERSAEHQRIYSRQLQGRLELARALALPKYEIREEATEEAKSVVLFSDTQSRALMQAASQLTARSQHFTAVAEELARPGSLSPAARFDMTAE
jgi:flavin-dependent dehydrogenase